jgi:hypothetical protein
MIDLWIAATGLTAIALLQFAPTRWRRYAPFFGLAGQPAWIWLAWQTESFGMLAVVSAYTILWCGGCLKELRA